MRLDDFDPDIKVGDQGNRGGGFGGGGGGGMLMGLLPFVFSRFGCGGVVVLLAIAFFLGGNPLGLISGGGQQTQTGQVAQAPGLGNATQICSTSPDKRAACNAFSSADKTCPASVLGSVWTARCWRCAPRARALGRPRAATCSACH